MILPITTVIETGNFVAQLSDGRQRRSTAEKLRRILEMVRDGRAPWVLHVLQWDTSFLDRFLAGADLAAGFVDLATAGLGSGDLCLLTERRLYQDRTGIPADIWTLDTQLASYS